VTKADAVHWQGTPSPLPAMLVWAAILAIALCIFAMLYWYMAITGRCIAVLLEDDCTKPSRSRMEVIFLVLAFIAAVAGSVVIKITLGFPPERYTITAREIASVMRKGDHLHFSGVGEKPVILGPLKPGDAERILRLISRLKPDHATVDDKG
jgi:hypothetical protein